MMQEKEVTLDPNSADVVIREIVRLKSLIESDTTTTPKQRRDLLDRIEVEFQAYQAWTQRYASYFREPRPWTPDLAPMPSDDRLLVAQELITASGERPRVDVFADFGGFSHRISYPQQNNPAEVRSHIEAMIPSNLHAYMEEWASEFNRHAWDDAMREKRGSMLWVLFDIQGMSIARSIKLCVGEAARVFYLKPSEDPFARYEYAREMRSDGEVPSDDHPSPGHSQEPVPEVIDLSLVEPGVPGPLSVPE